jgi:large subunit ribosomal protein L5
MSYAPRLKTLWQDASKGMQTDLGLKSYMMVPRLKKIVVNIGHGEAVANIKSLEHAVKDLQLITGQKPIMTKAKKSIAAFKLREGMPIGASVTLRGDRMWEFLDRFVNISVPQIRDFRGFSPKAFDGRGNYSVGVKEQLIFPEIEYDKIDKVRGLGITFVTSARNDIEAKALMDQFSFPFRK